MFDKFVIKIIVSELYYYTEKNLQKIHELNYGPLGK